MRKGSSCAGWYAGTEPEDYRLVFRVYGLDGVCVYAWPTPPSPMPREIFVLGECVAPSAERAGAVVRTTKQYLLHHGFPGRLSTAGNVAFPFTPPELSGGTAYRFNVYHIMQVDEPGAAVPGRARGSVIGPGRPGLLTARLPHRKGRPGTLERGSLEKCCPLRGTEGSNPSPSSGSL